jgi:4-hydroxy-2-oxoheptanedioate aldolase
MMNSRFDAKRGRRRYTILAIAIAVAVGSAGMRSVAQQGGAQKAGRLNRVIEALEAGRAAVGGQDWRFIDMEHGSFSMDQLDSILTQMGKDRDASGRLKLAPLVRIPQEGDEDFRWAVKQVLDAGAFGIVLPHVDTGEEAAKLVRTMRYPPTRDSKYPKPRGERGWGPTRAVRLWGVDTPTYHSKADVWPLNPNGELFAVAMIESGEAVRNIKAILATPVSAILVVPGDMSIDLGLGPRGDKNFPEVDEAYQTVLRACQAQKRVVCGCADSRSNMKTRLDEGWKFFLPLGG